MLAVCQEFPQGGCYPGDGHGLQGKGPQSPLHRRAGQPRPGLGQGRGVLPPHSAAAGAGEAPHAYHQLRGPPPHRHVGQAPGHRPTGYSLGAAGSAERVLEPDRHTALDHRALGCEVLAHSGQSQSVQAQEGRQIRVGEGSLRHVEVSRDGCVGTPIIGGPRPLPKQRRTHPTYELQQASATTPSNAKSPIEVNELVDAGQVVVADGLGVAVGQEAGVEDVASLGAVDQGVDLE